LNNPYQPLVGLTLEITELLKAKQLTPICSDGLRILHHVLPEDMKNWPYVSKKRTPVGELKGRRS
ncbi:hypothetical protein H0H93_011471, partial [Arthromyces matolae]